MRIAAASEPASASVRAKAISDSPGREVGEPARLLLGRARQEQRQRAELLDGEDQAGRGADAAELLDGQADREQVAAEAAVLDPGTAAPGCPARRAARRTSPGNSPLRSMSAARGAMRSSASARTASRRSALLVAQSDRHGGPSPDHRAHRTPAEAAIDLVRRSGDWRARPGDGTLFRTRPGGCGPAPGGQALMDQGTAIVLITITALIGIAATLAIRQAAGPRGSTGVPNRRSRCRPRASTCRQCGRGNLVTDDACLNCGTLPPRPRRVRLGLDDRQAPSGPEAIGRERWPPAPPRRPGRPPRPPDRHRPGRRAS